MAEGDDKELRIALDAMGGDHAPRAPVEAAAELSRTSAIRVVLVGDPERIEAELGRAPHRRDRIEILPAREVIGMADKPREALDAKPDASILVASRALADGAADGLVSAGSTGALVLAASRAVPLIEGVRRAALAAVYPTRKRSTSNDRFALLLDVGATVRCTAEQLLFFAYMGHAYASRISKVAHPTIGLLNMGEEETKGDEVLVAAHKLMKSDPRLNFVGNVEGNQLPAGVADVIVCEGLLGNVVLKMAEGVFETAKNIGDYAFKTKLRWRLGLALLSSGLRQIKALTDYGEYGGAPLLGLQKIVIKAHGRSGASTLVNAVKVAAKAARGGVADEIRSAVGQFSARGAVVVPAGE
jgi:glycerol-3-phosphate acyltransferase PlsX